MTPVLYVRPIVYFSSVFYSTLIVLEIFTFQKIFSRTPYFFMTAHMLSRWIESNAFLKSIKFRECVACYKFTLLNQMLRSMNTCSVVPLPFLYHACYFLNLQSTTILHSIFPTTGSKDMPVQELDRHNLTSSMRSPRLQLFGIFSFCHIVSMLSVTGVNSRCFPIL